jgi:hypothetical protein
VILRDRLRAIFSNVVLLFLSLTIAFLIGEAVIRMTIKDTVSLFPRYHTDAQYGDFKLRKIRPDSIFWQTSVDGSWKFETNAQGFRNRTNSEYIKPDGVVRIMSLGDSHTQGYEVRQDFTFSAVIEHYLDVKGYETEVLNTGVSGFSTAEELAFFENEGIKYDPDFVVVGFYANDFEDNIKAGLYSLSGDGVLSVAKTEHIPGVKIQNAIYSVPMVAWLGENSYFYSVLFNATWQFFKAKLAEDAAEAAIEYAIPTSDEHSNYEIELAAALLDRLHRFCKEHDIRLVILDIPQVTGESSFPHVLKARIDELSDAYVNSSALLAEYQGVAELHLPHGSQHISEFSHTILGVSAAKQIDSWLRMEKSEAAQPAP